VMLLVALGLLLWRLDVSHRLPRLEVAAWHASTRSSSTGSWRARAWWS